jgi:hypothetical protein
LNGHLPTDYAASDKPPSSGQDYRAMADAAKNINAMFKGHLTP